MHLDAGEVLPHNPAPIHIQVFQDKHPADATDQGIYTKTNLVSDWGA